MAEPHQRLARLFRGRTDAYGAVHGESMKHPLTESHWQSHVYHSGSVGVYPLCPRVGRDVYQEMHGAAGDVDKWVVHWGCVDIDDGYEVSLVPARNLQRAYSVLGLNSWIERTKGKGYHVWLLCSDWVPAVRMRAVQILACELIDYRPKEINPKQVELADGALGNYVNVPYAAQWVAQGKRVALRVDMDWSTNSGGIPYTLAQFLDAAEAKLNTPADIERVASLYRAPSPPRTVVFGRPTDMDLDQRVRGVARKLFMEGPLPSLTTGRVDRSAALAKLAHLLCADGFTAGEALSLVSYFDTRNDMQKYTDRKDAEQRYRDIVERVYGG